MATMTIEATSDQVEACRGSGWWPLTDEQATVDPLDEWIASGGLVRSFRQFTEESDTVEQAPPKREVAPGDRLVVMVPCPNCDGWGYGTEFGKGEIPCVQCSPMTDPVLMRRGSGLVCALTIDSIEQVLPVGMGRPPGEFQPWIENMNDGRAKLWLTSDGPPEWIEPGWPRAVAFGVTGPIKEPGDG